MTDGNERIGIIQRRIWAFLIDHILWMAFAVFVYWMSWDVYYVKMADNPFAVTMWVTMAVYFGGMVTRDWKDGRSFGKRRLGLMVRDQKGTLYRLSWFRLLLRNSTIVILPLEFLMLVFRDGKRLSDEWFGAQVMRFEEDYVVRPSSAHSGLQLASNSAEIETNSEEPGGKIPDQQLSLLDDFRFGRFMKGSLYWSGVIGGGVGVITFIIFTFVKPLQEELTFADRIISNVFFFLIQIPLILLIMGGAFAVLYFLPFRLFLRVMRNRNSNRGSRSR